MKKLIKGTPAANGNAEGIAHVITKEEDYEHFKEGEILVVRITDPTMTIIMNKASGIICDIGGIGSHPAIIARELGIPCIVNTKSGTKIIKTGTKIYLDATKGDVYAVD